MNIIRKMDAAATTSSAVGEGSVVCVQKYIRRPLLIDGLKVEKKPFHKTALVCCLNGTICIFHFDSVRHPGVRAADERGPAGGVHLRRRARPNRHRKIQASPIMLPLLRQVDKLSIIG